MRSQQFHGVVGRGKRRRVERAERPTAGASSAPAARRPAPAMGTPRWRAPARAGCWSSADMMGAGASGELSLGGCRRKAVGFGRVLGARREVI